MEENHTPEKGQTVLETPIKVRWTGFLRDRIAERHGDYVSHEDNPSNDESSRSVYRVLVRQKTNIVIETVEEAEYLISTLEWYAMPGITWMNGPMRKAARRVKNEIQKELENR